VPHTGSLSAVSELYQECEQFAIVIQTAQGLVHLAGGAVQVFL
jgi:hypothetical protein